MRKLVTVYRGFIAAMQLSYRFRLWGGELSAGIQGGMLEETFKGSEVVLPDDDDFHEGSDDAVPRNNSDSIAITVARTYGDKFVIPRPCRNLAGRESEVAFDDSIRIM